MARKPGAPKAAGGGKADATQYARFLNAACDLGCEEGMDRLDDALRRVARAPPQPRPHNRRARKEDEPEG